MKRLEEQKKLEILRNLLEIQTKRSEGYKLGNVKQDGKENYGKHVVKQSRFAVSNSNSSLEAN